jgi:hypothetical protein
MNTTNDKNSNKSKKKPLLITKSIERLQRVPVNNRTPLLQSLWRYCNKMETFKQRRADFLNNLVSFLIECISEMEISTLSIGTFYNKKDGEVDFYNEGNKFFAAKIGVCEKTISRIIAALEHAGYMKSKKLGAINTRGDFKKHHTLRTLTKKLFIELGIGGEEVDAAINYKRKDIKNRFKGKSLSHKCQTGLKRLSQTINHFLGREKEKQKPIAKQTSKQNISPSKTKRLLDQCSNLDEYRALLARQ